MSEQNTNFALSYNVSHNCERPPFVLSEAAMEPDARTPVHSHDEPHITLVLEGACEEDYLRTRQILASSNITYFHPGETHSLNIGSSPFRCFDIGFDAKWIGLFDHVRIEPNTVLGRQNTAVTLLVSQFYKEFKSQDDLSPLAMEGLAISILVELARSATPRRHRKPPDWLRKVEDRLNDDFAHSLTLFELAAEAGVHPSHLAEVFRLHHSCTPGEYLRRNRVERSIEMMTSTRLPLAKIAFATGFSDQSHFTRTFKKATGHTPARFRSLVIEN